jgi:hypothetical protein
MDRADITAHFTADFSEHGASCRTSCMAQAAYSLMMIEHHVWLGQTLLRFLSRLFQ